MKKLISILLCLLLLLTAFSGCDKKEPAPEPTDPSVTPLPDRVIYDGKLYSYERIDGQCYIIVKDLEALDTASPDVTQGALDVAPPYSCVFSSFDSLAYRVSVSGLSITQLSDLVRLNKDSNGKIKVCDFENMYIPSFPDSLTDVQDIDWYGDHYNWRAGSTNSGFLYSDMKEITEEKYKELTEKVFDFKGKEVFENTNVSGEKEYYYYNLYNNDVLHQYNAKGKVLAYEFQKGDTTYTVQESYVPKEYADQSLSTPNRITVYVKTKHGCFEFGMTGFNARPHPSWIAEFDIVHYKYDPSK